MITEIQVFDTSSTNRALASEGAIASQSSTLDWGFGSGLCSASIAIDGNTANQKDLPCYGLAHTTHEFMPWIMVELDARYDINRVVVWNRRDCCSWVLTGAIVTLLDEDMNPLSMANVGNAENKQSILLRHDVFGRSIGRDIGSVGIAGSVESTPSGSLIARGSGQGERIIILS